MPLSLFHKIFRVTTFLFFLVGTGILAAFLLTDNQDIAVAGYVYTKLAFAVNYLFLVVVLFRFVLETDKQNTLKTAGIMMLNIPVALVYMYVVLGNNFLHWLPHVVVPFNSF